MRHPLRLIPSDQNVAPVLQTHAFGGDWRGDHRYAMAKAGYHLALGAGAVAQGCDGEADAVEQGAEILHVADRSYARGCPKLLDFRGHLRAAQDQFRIGHAGMKGWPDFTDELANGVKVGCVQVVSDKGDALSLFKGCPAGAWNVANQRQVENRGVRNGLLHQVFFVFAYHDDGVGLLGQPDFGFFL